MANVQAPAFRCKLSKAQDNKTTVVSSQAKNTTNVSGVEVAPRLRQVFPGMTMAQIAQKLGVPHATVRNYFNGRLPATEILAKIAEETGVSLNWLLTNKGPQWAAHTAESGGEKEGVSQENGSSSRPRNEAVVAGPERAAENRVLISHMELIIEQNNCTIEQNNRIIQLLEELVNKSG